MNVPRVLSTAIAGLVAGALAVTTLAATPAQADQGNRSLARVLAADSGFDRNGRDFDIAEAAITYVLERRPNSPLAAVATGRTRLTVFLPTDVAFRRFVADLTGNRPRHERVVANRTIALAGNVATLETILLYHVVAGQTLPKARVLQAARASAAVETASGGRVGVRLDRDTVRLADADRDDLDPRGVAGLFNINVGNKQVAHGINRVLRPIDL